MQATIPLLLLISLSFHSLREKHSQRDDYQETSLKLNSVFIFAVDVSVVYISVREKTRNALLSHIHCNYVNRVSVFTFLSLL